MNYNPYAAPEANSQIPGTGTPGGHGPWAVGESLNAAWAAFAAEWPLFVFGTILIGLISATPLAIALGGVFSTLDFSNPAAVQAAMRGPSFVGATLGGTFVTTIIGAFFGAGLIQMRLAAVRGVPVSFGMLFGGGSRFGSLLGVQLILSAPSLLLSALSVGIMSAGGNLMTLVPVINLLSNGTAAVMLILQACGLAFADYCAVDRNEGPIRAIASAWKMASEMRSQVFVYFLLVGLIFIGGLMLCCFPIVVASPYCGVAAALLYHRVSRNYAG